MLAKLEILLGKYAIYIIAGSLAVSAVMGAGWYASNLKLDASREKAANAEMRLTSSNNTIASLKGELKGINTTLEENQKAQEAIQNKISDQLRAVISNDKSRVELETWLRSRPSTLKDCAVPKDLMDAWNKM